MQLIYRLYAGAALQARVFLPSVLLTLPRPVEERQRCIPRSVHATATGLLLYWDGCGSTHKPGAYLNLGILESHWKWQNLGLPELLWRYKPHPWKRWV